MILRFHIYLSDAKSAYRHRFATGVNGLVPHLRDDWGPIFVYTKIGPRSSQKFPPGHSKPRQK